ncbi:hypothetical protein JW935_29140 [candidate division KSB1 bacterium]|nr:hypothetical protein [candidate division KSB1 bacterium]
MTGIAGRLAVSYQGILWSVFDGEVNAILPTGDILSYSIPTPNDGSFASFPKANLLVFPDKGVCLAHNDRLWSLNISDQTLIVEEMAGGIFPINVSDLIVSPLGELCMSGEDNAKNKQTWSYTDDSWKIRGELGDFLTIDDSGNLWFYGGDSDSTFNFAKGYTVVTEKGLERLPLRGIKWVGEVNSTGQGSMLASCGNAILHIAHDGNRWSVDRVSLLSPESTYLVNKAFLDSSGKIFFGFKWASPCP